MRTAAFTLALLLATPSDAQMVTDGDTIKLNGKPYRISGIDAPELHQDCDGWPAGRLAATAMQHLMAGRTVTCEGLGHDRYRRTIARCFAGGADLGAAMVRNGWAWAFRRYSLEYVRQEDQARAEGLGIHAHHCELAWEWRAERR